MPPSAPLPPIFPGTGSGLEPMYHTQGGSAAGPMTGPRILPYGPPIGPRMPMMPGAGAGGALGARPSMPLPAPPTAPMPPVTPGTGAGAPAATTSGRFTPPAPGGQTDAIRSSPEYSTLMKILQKPSGSI